MKRKYAIALAVVLIVATTAAAFAWMRLSNIEDDDVEVLDQPMTLTLLSGPTSIFRGTWPEGPISTWTFNLSVDSGVVTQCDFHARISWEEYNSSESYGSLVWWKFNNTQWGGGTYNAPDYLDISSNMKGPDGEWTYQWQTGNSTSFTFDIIIDTQMPVGIYHFEFAVYGSPCL
jgi:hypothetical protein